MAKKKASAHVKEMTNESIDLDFISPLGGEKSDLGLIAGIDSDEDEELDDFDEDFGADPVSKNDLSQFIKELGIQKYREDIISQPEEEDNLPEVNTKKKEKEENTKKSKKKGKKEKIQHDEVSSTTTSSFSIESQIKNYKPRTYLLVKSGQSWLDVQVPCEVKKSDHSRELEQQMENFASKLLQDEVAVYKKQREASKKSEIGWIKTVLTSGTLGDKIAALTLLVQESPIQNLSSLESLINMTKKKGKRESMMAADTTKELFLTYLLPGDRKLRTFDQHPLSNMGTLTGGNKDTVDKYLMVWLYEAKLKELYSSYVKSIEMMSHDTLGATKQKALAIAFDLLCEKPEQEKFLLNLLVNKVGDPNYKLASKTAYLLKKLVEKHPNMKSVVVDEVERLLYRPNISTKAQYYSICFLIQLRFTREDKLLAVKLVTVYFTFFKSFVKKGEVDSKMMSALLTGVNRCYPYAKVDPEYLAEELNTIYKLVHVVNFNTSIQALLLLYQVMDSSQTISDRYYVTLYKKMSDPSLKSSAKQAMFLNLLFKSIKKDSVDRRIKAFVKRLLQICFTLPPPFVCGALVLLGELVKTKPSLIVKKQTVVDSDDDEEEHFVDIPDSDSEQVEKPAVKAGNRKTSSWVHVKGGSSDHYDPHCRNPLYCNADQECIWELNRLAKHFHPTVSMFATKLIKGEPVTYTGDPLEDFTTIRFLDRFVYKNPKKKDALPKATMSHKVFYPKGIKSIPVNSDKYIENSEENIPVEELFYYRYFTQKAARKKTRDDEEMSDSGSVSDSEFDDFLENYEKNFDDGLLDDEDLDFAKEVSKGMGKKTKGKPDSDSEEEDDEDNEVDDDLSDEEVDFEGDEDFASEFKDFDDDMEMMNEDDVEFSDDDEFSELSETKKRKGGKKDNLTSKKKKKELDTGSLFAAAEEFSHMIEDNSDLKGSLMIGADAVSNKDNAHIKQLKWEADRDRKMRMGGRGNKKTKKFNKRRK